MDELGAVAGIGTNRREHGLAGKVETLEDRSVLGWRGVASKRGGHWPAEVDVLDEHPAAGADGGEQVGQRGVVVGNVFNEGTGVDQVEGGLFGSTAGDVMRAHFQVRAVVFVDEARVQIGGDHSSGVPDPIGEPQGHRSGTAADLEATPSLGDAEAGEVAGRRTVVEGLQTAAGGRVRAPKLGRRCTRS